QLGWGLLGIGLIFVWIFALRADLTPLRLRGAGVRQTIGVVTGTEPTAFAEGEETRIYAVRYTFNAEDGLHTGTSYARGAGPAPGARVLVEYLQGQPSWCRVQGMRGQAFPPLALCLILVPLAGLGILASALRRGSIAARLLARGRLALARLETTTKMDLEV